MRIIQLSDLHYCDKHLEEISRVMEYSITCINNGLRPDLIVISGDTFDHRLEQNSRAFLAALRAVNRLAEIAPVLILQGTYSHDAPGSVEVFSSLNGAHQIYVADRIQQVVVTMGGEIAPYNTNECNNILALISCLPTVNKANVAAAVGAEDAATATGEYVARLLQSWAPSNNTARHAGVATILISHGTVSEAITEHGVPMAGLDHEYTTGSLFASQAQAIMLGHIHKHQQWEKPGQQIIAYPGSLGRLHYGEKDPKGFLVWDIESGVKTTFLETPAKRLIEINFTGLPDLDELRRIAGEASGAHIRIRYAVDEEHRGAVDKAALTALFSSAADLKIEGTINPVVRTRAQGIGQAASLQDRLTKWCEVTQSDSRPLLERLELIQAHSAEFILEDI